MIEALETRAPLADGIAPAAGSPIGAMAGVAINDAVFATYTISDPSGAPGDQWRALINFGDGQVDGPVIPVEHGGGFEFVDTHTYRAPGTYTVTVMIALPGSHNPNENTVTTQVTVKAATPTPTPTPAPTPTPTAPIPPATGPFTSAGLSERARAGRARRGPIARFSDPHTHPGQFTAAIDWGDQSGPTPGRIRRQGRGRYTVVGSHRYGAPGAFPVTVTIRDADGAESIARSSVAVKAR
jgi:hypothetical protein